MPDPVEVHPSGRAGTKRLVRGTNIIGTLLKGTDGRWKVYDEDRHLVTEETFANTPAARDAFARLEGSERLPERLPEPLEIESAGVGHAKRLVRGGQVVGMLSQMMSGRWSVNDTNDVPLSKRTFSTPAQARDFFVELEQQAPQKDA